MTPNDPSLFLKDLKAKRDITTYPNSRMSKLTPLYVRVIDPVT